MRNHNHDGRMRILFGLSASAGEYRWYSSTEGITVGGSLRITVTVAVCNNTVVQY
jgi:hypothetical protein